MTDYLYGGFVVIGLILFSYAIFQYKQTQKLLMNGVKTKAVVIELIETRDDDGTKYKPVFEFTDRNDNNVIFKSNVATSPSPYKINDKVSVVYNPQDKKEVKVISYWGLYRWTIVLLCIAAPLLIIGGGYLIYSRG